MQGQIATTNSSSPPEGGSTVDLPGNPTTAGARVSTASPRPTAHKSSPTVASVDSFSSYINKDAPLFHNRSSSPRPEDQQCERSDPASERGSPQPQQRRVITTPIIPREAFRHRWAEVDLVQQQPQQLSPSKQNLTMEQFQSRANAANEAVLARRQHVSLSPSPSIDVNQLSVKNLARQDAEQHVDSACDFPQAAAKTAEDSFEADTSVQGDDSKTDIRRRRRTRPDEANLLTEAYARNPFPDHETRLYLANRVGMTVRAVSVWFQNRRQAEKKRSGRFGGSGIPASASGTKSEVSTELFEAVESQDTPSVEALQPSNQRKPFGNASANNAKSKPRSEAIISDFSNSNKENIPPWLAARAVPDGSVREQLAELKRSSHSKPATESLVASTASRSRSRDLRQALGPDGAGLEVSHATEDTAVPKAPSIASKVPLSRHRSTPRLSLDDVLSDRAHTLRRSTTHHVHQLPKSSDIEEDDLDTILPMPKVLSRVSSSSSLSLLTTAGGRASLGTLLPDKSANPSVDSEIRPSLNASLPPQLTTALQKHGIIAADAHDPVRASSRQMETKQELLQKMPSSSISSSDFDAFQGQDDPAEMEEDEERTLKLIAHRRAAKAHAQTLAQSQARARVVSADGGDANVPVPVEPTASDARDAIAQARVGISEAGEEGRVRTIFSRSRSVVGLGKGPSLDWAAGRNRACTTALPHSVTGTPFSRSVSSSQLLGDVSLPLTQESPLSKSAVTRGMPTGAEKRSSASLRSVSASDLTRRLQEAKQKGTPRRKDSRKRTAKSLGANDENARPLSSATETRESPKRRRQQVEAESADKPNSTPSAATINVEQQLGSKDATVGLMAAPRSEVSPMLSGRPFLQHNSFPSSAPIRAFPVAGMPSTPKTAALYSAGSTLPLSTRSDRFKAIGASPAGSLGRSISASYHSHHQMGRPLPQSRQSSAREQQRGSAAYEPLRPASQEAIKNSRMFSDENWTPSSQSDSHSQPLPLAASTPSRVLGDRSNFSMTPSLSHTVGSSPFLHDDSGFFGSLSEDEEHNHEQLRTGGANKRIPSKYLPAAGDDAPGSISPRKASLRSSNGKDRRFATPGEDRQAAELLLGLHKTNGSKDGSSQ